ncbi:uncharacterized protein LOC126401090 [Epinephelus moara]|uniref:uncharacterized protein LOC126401090 n=1 Tax=Epinephelus moara TaxID=300413 RepID=UPI00214F5A71|nr:uncharacterized protein LOC126401090 [Epinephelus moara]
MPVLRRWWCLLLLENNTLNSYGKVFAHWTKECQELLEGKHAPVFRLKRKAEQDTEETMAERASDEECAWLTQRDSVFQTSRNTGQRLLYPDAESLEWIQCQMCKGWLHKECAGKDINDDSFNCGCTDISERPSIMDTVEKGRILAVFSKTQIKSLHDDLINGSIRSNRMYLWQDPSTSINLKQHLKLRALNFSDQRIFELLRMIEEATGIGEKIKRGEIGLLDFVFDVMLPEILIKILQEGMTRLKAEITMASGSLF